MSIVIWCGREISEQGVSFTFRRIYSYHSLKLKYEYTGENNHLFSASCSSAKTSVHFYKHGSSREWKIRCFKFRAVGEKREEIGERQESFNCHGITVLNKTSYWLEAGILPLNINEYEVVWKIWWLHCSILDLHEKQQDQTRTEQSPRLLPHCSSALWVPPAPGLHNCGFRATLQHLGAARVCLLPSVIQSGDHGTRCRITGFPATRKNGKEVTSWQELISLPYFIFFSKMRAKPSWKQAWGKKCLMAHHPESKGKTSFPCQGAGRFEKASPNTFTLPSLLLGGWGLVKLFYPVIFKVNGNLWAGKELSLKPNELWYFV